MFSFSVFKEFVTHIWSFSPTICDAPITDQRRKQLWTVGYSHTGGDGDSPVQHAVKPVPDFWRLEVVEEAASFIRNQLPENFPAPTIGIICGSGCGAIGDAVTERHEFDYNDIPHFTPTTVRGHKGVFIVGKLGGKTVAVLQGRFHAYEGYHYGQAAFPVRVMGFLGAKTLVITSAAGALNPAFGVGDFMIVKDHLSMNMLGGNNPLTGPNDDRMGPRFVALNNAYDRDLRKVALETSEKLGFYPFTRVGDMVQVAGPNFETPMDLRFLKLIGADVVGMSNAHECTVARHMDIKVLSICLVSNLCIFDPDDANETNHADNLQGCKSRETDLAKYVEQIVGQI